MEEIRAGAMPAFQKRLQERLTELLRASNVEPQRLAQEAALLADRSEDICAGADVAQQRRHGWVERRIFEIGAVADGEVTLVNTVPSLMAAALGDGISLPASVRTAVFCGENGPLSLFSFSTGSVQVAAAEASAFLALGFF